MSCRILVAIALASLTIVGCYRTRYVNFEPPPDGGERVRELTSIAEGYTKKNGWQHFYLFGWVPSKRTYPVDVICLGADRIESIQTRRTFTEGLVAAFAGYYINVYSPYNAAFECKPPPAAQDEQTHSRD